jgi:regulatory protein
VKLRPDALAFCFKGEKETRGMSKITALRAGRGRGKRVNIYLDGKFAFSLEAEVAIREGLRVEQELSTERIKTLSGADNLQRCLNAAALYLSYRPRSEPELRERLRRRGFDEEIVEKTVSRLSEQGLVDDAAFARFWTENREYFSPRSQRLTRLELRKKGVAGEIIDRVVGSIDDEESAYRAAEKKARSLSRADYRSFRRRLGDHLRRRGFSYWVISRAVEKLWREGDEEVNTEY